MTQLIDVLVAEIEKRISSLHPKGGQGMVVTKILKDHYKDLLSLINALEVKEVGVDLEKEYKEVEEDRPVDVDIDMSGEFVKVPEMQEEPVSEDLEEAANFYANTHIEYFDSEGNPCVMPAFKAGAKWQKEQMMSKAIKGIARPDDNEIWCNLASSNFKDDDEVKVIVIKEE